MENVSVKRIKQYYRIKFELTSPLSIGSGENNFSDKDILVDGRGYPYIPGTALAGVYRHLFSNEVADEFFGKDLTEERKQTAMDEGRNVLTDSNIVVYDAVLCNPEQRIIKVRDMVALNEYKVAKKGAKFDFQILGPGAVFVTYIEQNIQCKKIGDHYETCDRACSVSNEIAYAWKKKEIQLGAKTGRGYGATKALEIHKCCFNLSDQAECKKWLDFDMYEDKVWIPCEELNSSASLRKPNDKVEIVLKLQQQGAISVRQYSTDINEADYSQMTIKEDTPVIPGTTWAGAFRAQMEKLAPEFGRDKELTKKFFGDAKEKKNANIKSENQTQVKQKKKISQKTRISFSESTIEGERWETYTRNAIDRFSGGTVDCALYTEHTCFDGKTELSITCDFSDWTKNDEKNKGKRHLITDEDRGYFAAVLSAAILDLNEGIMSVGGLTAVGHGLFTVEEIIINGQAVHTDYQSLRKAIVGKESEK